MRMWFGVLLCAFCLRTRRHIIFLPMLIRFWNSEDRDVVAKREAESLIWGFLPRESGSLIWGFRVPFVDLVVRRERESAGRGGFKVSVAEKSWEREREVFRISNKCLLQEKKGGEELFWNVKERERRSSFHFSLIISLKERKWNR